MPALIDLEGTSRKSIESLFITKGSDIEVILANEYAATTAGHNGAINVWKDDDGNIRCEVLKHFASIEKKTYSSLSLATIWVNKWIKKIK